MADQPSGVEVSNPTFGSIKIFGTDPNTLFTVIGVILSGVIAFGGWMHIQDAKAGGQEVAKEIKESNRDIAKVLAELAKQIKIKNCTDAIPATVTPKERQLLVESCRTNQ